MSNFKVGDVVEGIDRESKQGLLKYGNVVVSISPCGVYLRFPGCPQNGYRADRFKVVEQFKLENE